MSPMGIITKLGSSVWVFFSLDWRGLLGMMGYLFFLLRSGLRVLLGCPGLVVGRGCLMSAGWTHVAVTSSWCGS